MLGGVEKGICSISVVFLDGIPKMVIRSNLRGVLELATPDDSIGG